MQTSPNVAFKILERRTGIQTLSTSILQNQNMKWRHPRTSDRITDRDIAHQKLHVKSNGSPAEQRGIGIVWGKKLGWKKKIPLHPASSSRCWGVEKFSYRFRSGVSISYLLLGLVRRLELGLLRGCFSFFLSICKGVFYRAVTASESRVAVARVFFTCTCSRV
jgi:hypothetical protein